MKFQYSLPLFLSAIGSTHADLSSTKLYKYLPLTDVSNEASVDLDLQLIRDNLIYGTHRTFAFARDVYTEGNATQPLNFQGISIESVGKCPDAEYCPYPTLSKYLNYYGKADYADNIVNAGFDGKFTDLSKGNQDFRFYAAKGKKEVVEKTITLMTLWMHVILKLEEAIDDCHSGCEATDCKETPPDIHAWDEAVAFYTGSNPSTDGKGVMLFELADQLCTDFITCGEMGTEESDTSYVNREIFNHFIEGQEALLAGKCRKARKVKEDIEHLMRVPLIQGTLHMTHILAYEEEYHEHHGAEGAILAMALLPLIHDCTPEDAEALFHNTYARDEAPEVDFIAVKTLLERNYKCMEVTCEQVGGFYDKIEGRYQTDAEPCVSGLNDQGKVIVGGFMSALIGIFLVAVIVVIVRRASSRKVQSTSKHGDETEAEFPIEGDTHSIL